MSAFEAAAASDLPEIRDWIERFRLDPEGIETGQFVVLREKGRLAAIGRIKPYGDGVYELGTVAVREDLRGKGLGKRIVRELVRRFPSKQVYLTTDLPAYFEPLGFRRIAGGPKAIRDKLATVCQSLRCGSVAMVLEKP